MTFHNRFCKGTLLRESTKRLVNTKIPVLTQIENILSHGVRHTAPSRSRLEEPRERVTLTAAEYARLEALVAALRERGTLYEPV